MLNPPGLGGIRGAEFRSIHRTDAFSCYEQTQSNRVCNHRPLFCCFFLHTSEKFLFKSNSRSVVRRPSSIMFSPSPFILKIGSEYCLTRWSKTAALNSCIERSVSTLASDQGWQSTDRPGKPGFSRLDKTPRNGSTGQYWVIFSPRFHYEIL